MFLPYQINDDIDAQQCHDKSSSKSFKSYSYFPENSFISGVKQRRAISFSFVSD